MILDGEFFASLERERRGNPGPERAALRRIVVASCQLKATVVTRDEREETGLRAVLNFGHTIGHAIEAVAGYDGPFQHGEAVAVGMVAEAGSPNDWAGSTADVVDRLIGLLERFGLPTAAPGSMPTSCSRPWPRQEKPPRQDPLRPAASDRRRSSSPMPPATTTSGPCSRPFEDSIRPA